MVGLHKHCICLDLFGADTCECSGIENSPDWFKATKALCGFAVGCMVVATVLSIICAVHEKNTKQWRMVALFFVAGSGILLLVSVIVYGVESTGHIESILAGLQYIDGIDFYSLTKFGYSYILVAVATSILIALCIPLLVYDLYKEPKQHNPVAPTAPVHYGHQVHVVTLPHGSGYGGQGPMQPTGAPPAYSYTGPPPPGGLYNQQQYPPTAPATYLSEGVPPKS
ncbi:hypothetical protein ACF0H5_010456 [Mactra antiquata]